MSTAEGAITRAASQLPQEEGGGDEQRKRGNDSFALRLGDRLPQREGRKRKKEQRKEIARAIIVRSDGIAIMLTKSP